MNFFALYPHLPETNKWLVAICTKHEVECPPPHTNYRLLDALCGKYIEKSMKRCD
jgi:lysyl-tRNA synthetase class 2